VTVAGGAERFVNTAETVARGAVEDEAGGRLGEARLDLPEPQEYRRIVGAVRGVERRTPALPPGFAAALGRLGRTGDVPGLSV
jgi:hypothetical protein